MRVSFLLLVLFWSISALAQNVITGQVLDSKTRERLLGAHVYLVSNWQKGAITDIDGKFSLTLDHDYSEDSIIISYVGFKEQMIKVEQNMLVLMEELEYTGQTVTVTAKPLIAEEFKFIQMKKLDIYTNPAAKADPILAVNSLPSSTTTDESANISLRGSSPIETGIFLNNVPIYDAVRYSQLNGIGTFSIFNTAIIQNVTVFPGNPPLEFGNVSSGAISLRTDDQILKDNTNSLAVSLANVGFSREQKISENQSLKVFANWQPSQVIKALNHQALEEIESFNSADFGVYWYGARKNMNWKILNYSNTEGYEFNYQHPSFRGIFDQQKFRNFFVSSIDVPIGQSTLSFNQGFGYSKGQYRYSNVAFDVKKRDLFTGVNIHTQTEKLSFKSGVSFDYRYSEVEGNVHEFFYAIGNNHPTININEDSEVKTLEGFTYFKYYLSDNLTVGTGLRKNIPSEGQDNYLSSQINLAWQSGSWSTTVGAGQYNKSGLFENSGNTFFTNSRQLSFDFKYEKQSGLMSLSVFKKDAVVNNEGYTSVGAELFFNKRLSSVLTASGSLTWIDVSNDTEAASVYDLDYFIRGNVAYSPGSFWTIESILLARQGSMFTPVSSSNFDANLMVYEPLYAEVQERYPKYLNLSLSVSKLFPISETKNIIAFASLNNALDSRNVRSYMYNFDYTSTTSSFFSRRTSYFGFVYNF